MAAYAYNAINSAGVETAGELHAPDDASARASSCASAACSPPGCRSCDASGEASARTAFKKVKPKSLQIFSRQFATMIEAGLNVVGALVILEEQTDDKYLGDVIREVRADVEGGMLLSQAMARHPEGVQPPVRRDGRGRRGGGNPRHRARPRRVPDREGDGRSSAASRAR